MRATDVDSLGGGAASHFVFHLKVPVGPTIMPTFCPSVKDVGFAMPSGGWVSPYKKKILPRVDGRG